MIKRDLLKEIKSLDEKTNPNQIKGIIFYDVKQELITNELIECLKLKSDSKITKEKLKYNNDKKERNNKVKNWLRYKVVANLTTNIDCDTSDLTKSILCNLYDVKKQEDSDTNRYFEKNGTTYESDTMNSYATIFGIYIRNLLKEKGIEDGKLNKNSTISEIWKTYYSEKYKYIKGNTKDNYASCYYWTLEELDNLEEYSKKSKSGFNHELIWQNLNTFALLTSSISNFSLVPYRFNSYRYTPTSDYWDSSLKYLKDNKSNLEELAVKLAIYQKRNVKKYLKTPEFEEEYAKTLKSLEGYYNKEINTDLDKIDIERDFDYLSSLSVIKSDYNTYETINKTLEFMINNILIKSYKALRVLNSKLKNIEPQISEILYPEPNNIDFKNKNNFVKATINMIIENLKEKRNPTYNPIYFYNAKYAKTYSLAEIIMNKTINDYQVQYVSTKIINKINGYAPTDLLIIGDLEEVEENSELANKLIEIIDYMTTNNKQLILTGSKELKALKISPKLRNKLEQSLSVCIFD